MTVGTNSLPKSIPTAYEGRRGHPLACASSAAGITPGAGAAHHVGDDAVREQAYVGRDGPGVRRQHGRHRARVVEVAPQARVPDAA